MTRVEEVDLTSREARRKNKWDFGKARDLNWELELVSKKAGDLDGKLGLGGGEVV